KPFASTLLLALAVATTNSLLAGTPASGTLYYSVFGVAPSANVKRVDYSYDGGANFYASNIVAISALPNADGMIFLPDGELLAAGDANALYKVNRDTGSYVTVAAAGTTAGHLSLD